jgi:L-histidine Nalpha-methyltransferase
MSRVVMIDRGPERARFVEEVVAGLSLSPKSIGPKWFYDKLGSKLFEAICELPEYYPTRTENCIFRQHAGAMADRAGRHRVLVELGSGSGDKVRALLPHLDALAYVAVDISREVLTSATASLAEELPALPVYAVCDDFSTGFEVPVEIPEARRLYFYPGSSIGNFSPAAAVALLSPLARQGDGLLIGVDLLKDPATLQRAYDDSLGVTAAFNLNLLARINRELAGDFDLRQFRHVALFDPDASRIEMHLESVVEQRVSVGLREFQFGAGERLHTENSHKYTVEGFSMLAARAGWKRSEVWTDERGWFAEMYFEA